MILFYCLIAVVFLFCRSTATCAPGNSTILQGDNITFIGCEISMKDMNRTSNSTNCKLRLVDQSKIKAVLSKHENSTTTNTVRINIFVLPGNKTRYFQDLELPWANEIGRTIISLARRARGSIFTSPLFTWMLEVGIEEVDILVQEEIDGCLPPGEKGSDLIFDFLLPQLSHSGDTHVFKLCRERDQHSIQYNCCRMFGEKNVTICADYSSAVVKVALPLLVIVILISFFMIIPFIIEYILTCSKEKFYRTSDSHMSLVAVLSKTLFEGRESGKSFFRRCVFAGVSVLVFLPDFFGCLWLQILFWSWAIIFVFIYDGDITECVSQEKQGNKFALDRNLILGLKKPFSYFFDNVLEFGKRFENPGHYCYLSFIQKRVYAVFVFSISLCYVVIIIPLRIAVALLKFTFVDFLFYFIILHEYDERAQTNSKSIVHLLFTWLLGFLAYFVLLLSSPLVLWCKTKKKCDQDETTALCDKAFEIFKQYCKSIIRLVTFVNIVFFTGMTLIFILSVIVGLTLNAEYFSPFVAPILTLIVFFWKNWKFSVEARCLQLKTLIFEICKEKASAVDGMQDSTNINDGNNANWKELVKVDTQKEVAGKVMETKRKKEERKNANSTEHDSAFPSDNESVRLLNCDGNGANVIERRTTTTKVLINNEENSVETKELEVGFDEHGEGLISRKLYKEISKEILPLEHLLFYFFRRVSFVFVYAFMMFTVMILSRDAGISENLQVIGAIVGVLIPFVFDTIYADHHLSQKASQNVATKEKLLHILKFKKVENNIVFVELIKIKNNKGENHEERQDFKNECSQAWKDFKKHFSLCPRGDNNHV